MINLIFFCGLLMVVGGSIGAYTEFISPMLGAGLMGGGLAALGILFFIINIPRKKKPSGGNWVAFFFGLLSLGALGNIAYVGLRHPINDLTTDTKTPPAFRNPAFPFKAGNGREYLDPTLQLERNYDPEMSLLQSAHYPELDGMDVKAAPKDVYPEVIKTIRSQFPQWLWVLNDPTTLHAELEVETAIFHFIDDVAIEVRPHPKQTNQSRVEFRSRSRVGRGDFGTNFARLIDLKSRLTVALKPVEQAASIPPPILPLPVSPVATMPPPPAPKPMPAPKASKNPETKK